jgi:uncharacterized protein YkwD
MGFGCGNARKRLLWLAAAPLLALLAVLATTGSSSQQALALDDQEAAFLNMINQYRAANGMGGLTVNGPLTTDAQWMAQDMATNNRFAHEDSQGRNPFQRMDYFGYSYNTWRGENLAAGIDDAQRAMQLWQDSPGHNANMLNANYTVVGISRAFGPTSAYTWYWATEFGGQGDPPPPPAPAPAPYVPPAPQPPAPAPQAVPDPTAPPAPVPTAAPAPVVTAAPTPVALNLVDAAPINLHAATPSSGWWPSSFFGRPAKPAASPDSDSKSSGGTFLSMLLHLARTLAAAHNHSLVRGL